MIIAIVLLSHNCRCCSTLRLTDPASAEWIPPSASMKSVIAKRYSTILITCLADGYPTPRLTLQEYDVKLTQWVNTGLVPDLLQANGTQTTWRLHYNFTNNATEKLRCFAFNNFTNYKEDHGFLVETYSKCSYLTLSITNICSNLKRVFIDILYL